MRTLPEYLYSLKGKKNPKPEGHKIEESSTPLELIEMGYEQLRKRLYLELIEQIKSCSPKFFDSLVVDLLLKMGYGGTIEDAGQALGRSGDEGID